MSFLGSALGSVVSGLFGLAGGSMQQQSAMAQLEKQAELQRQNWEYAQKNAHQFEVEDLRNAGLNPILSATHSQLAGMSSVGSASGSSAYSNLGSNISSAITSALENDRKKEEINLKSKEVELEKQRVELQQQTTALDLEMKEKQMDKLDNDIRIDNANLELRKALTNADIDVRKKNAFQLSALAYKHIADSDLSNSEKVKLEQQMKYGYLIASYLPMDAREFAYDNIVTWVHDHEDDIKAFMQNPESMINPGKVVKAIFDLYESGGD